VDVVRSFGDADASGPLEADSIEMFSDVVTCRDWRLSAEALSLLPPSPLRFALVAVCGSGSEAAG
jgi:hypothetical protein